VLLGLAWLGQTPPARSQDGIPEEWIQDRYIVILFSSEDFHRAEREARRLAESSRTPFSMDDRVYDPKRGLILSDQAADEMYRGQYLPRRFHGTVSAEGEEQGYLSVEKSEAYQGLPPDRYVVVAGIRETKAQAQKDVRFFRTWAPDAFFVKSRLYLGCIH